MLLDTSGLLCLYHQSEPFHQQAVQAYKATQVRLTHSYVLAEFVALATARRFPLHREAFALLLARRDKEYSLCDAMSFVLMRQRNLFQALTTDKHFEQEGFVRLLK